MPDQPTTQHPETQHPNLTNPNWTPATPTGAAIILGARPSGPPTAYRFDPNQSDPASRAAWTIKRHPRGLTMTSRPPLKAPLAFAAIFATVAATLFALYFTSTITDTFLLIAAAFMTLCAILPIAAIPFIIKHQSPVTVLDHDAMADTLTIHNERIDPDDAIAIERIAFATGDVPPDDAPQRENGGSYTTRVHLVLKSKLPNTNTNATTNPTETHPTSNDPGTRYHLIAATHLGLCSEGQPIAKSLNIPYTETNLGTFTTTLPEFDFRQ